MALSADYRHYVFLDSAKRDRKSFPFPSQFISVIKYGDDNNQTDPVASAFILYQDVITAYTSGTPDFVTLTGPIPPSIYDDELIDMYVMIVDPLTRAIKGTARVAGIDTTKTNIFLSAPIAGVVAGDIIYIRQIAFNPIFRTVAGAVAGNTVVITGGSSVNNYYVGNFIRVVNFTGIGSAFTSSRIVNYVGATKVATFSPAILPAIVPGNFIEIYNIQDNNNGLSEPGAYATKTSMVNHEIKLEWMRIPRQPLFVNELVIDGEPLNSVIKLISDFPYLIIRFRGVGNGSNNIIQSNNKATKNAQFLIPVEDMSTGVGKFITLRSSYYITMKYEPIESIDFAVLLPDGTPIQFDPQDENLDLTQANPDLQISALFSIKRVLHN